MTNQKGIAPVLVIVLVLIALVIVILYGGKFGPKTPAVLTTPSTSLAPTPTPTPTPKPSPIPTKSPTPKPTQAAVSGPPGAGYSTITVATEKGNFSASVLSIDLNSARMITDTGNDSDCGGGCIVLPLADYVNRNQGFAGVNGTYFCPAEPAYSSCGANNSYDFPVVVLFSK